MPAWLEQLEKMRMKHENDSIDSKRYSLECEKQEGEKDEDFEDRKRRVAEIAADRYMRDKGIY